MLNLKTVQHNNVNCLIKDQLSLNCGQGIMSILIHADTHNLL